MTVQRSFFAELQRRHVYKVGAMYAVAGWLLVQVATQVFPFFDISNAAVRWVVIAVVAGFPIALVLAWLFDITPEGIVRTEQLPPSGEVASAVRIRRSTERKLNYVLGALLLIALAYVVLARSGRVDRWLGGANVDGGDQSIAVLPFENLSDDKANAYFAVGIQDEILTRLAKVHTLKVISRTSTMHFASSPDNLPEIARSLGVSAILEGSVQRAGETVHVNVQLIRAATDQHLWAESYNRKLDDIFAVQGEIAQTVAEALRVTLTGAEQQQMSARPTAIPEAYDAYLRGLVHDGRFAQSQTDLQDWAQAYEDAVRLDPNFAAAWAGLARVYVEWYYDIDTRPQRLQMAKLALDQAMRLAPDAAETYEALGLYRYWGLNDYDAALEAYGEALKRKPGAASSLYAMGNVRRRQGHWTEALQLQQRAAELDPLSATVAYNLTLTLRALRRFDEAQAVTQKGLAANPGDTALLGERIYTEQARGDLHAAHAYAEQLPLDAVDFFPLTHRLDQWLFERDYARAIAEVTQVLKRRADFDPGTVAFALSYLGLAESLAGDSAASNAAMLESRKINEEIRAAGDTNPFGCLGLALASAYIGDREAAVRYIGIAEAGVSGDAMSLPQAAMLHAIVDVKFGDKDGAIRHLIEAQRAPTAWGAFPAILRESPQFDALRGDPRFEALTRDPPASTAAAAAVSASASSVASVATSSTSSVASAAAGAPR